MNAGLKDVSWAMEIMTSLPSRYNALVFGASGGIGSAIASHLENDVKLASIIALSRQYDGMDITIEESVSRQIDQLRSKTYNLIICATGALTIDGVGPEKSLKQFQPAAMARQFAVNSIGPAILLKHCHELLDRRERAIFAFLSARVGSITDNYLGGWVSYRASKAALNQIVRTASVEYTRTHPKSILLAVHPGTVDTRLSEPFASGHDRLAPEVAAITILKTLDDTLLAATGSFIAYNGADIPW